MKRLFLTVVGVGLLLAACSPGETAAPLQAEAEPAPEVAQGNGESAASQAERFPASKYEEYDIVTLLPRDAIPAIDNPEFISASEADSTYAPDELVIGVEFNGDARAYSVPLLSGHEIVNDSVGGVKIAVTW